MDEGNGAWIGTNQAPRMEVCRVRARRPDQAGGVRQRVQESLLHLAVRAGGIL